MNFYGICGLEVLRSVKGMHHCMNTLTSCLLSVEWERGTGYLSNQLWNGRILVFVWPWTGPPTVLYYIYNGVTGLSVVLLYLIDGRHIDQVWCLVDSSVAFNAMTNCSVLTFPYYIPHWIYRLSHTRPCLIYLFKTGLLSTVTLKRLLHLLSCLALKTDRLTWRAVSSAIRPLWCRVTVPCSIQWDIPLGRLECCLCLHLLISVCEDEWQ